MLERPLLDGSKAGQFELIDYRIVSIEQCAQDKLLFSRFGLEGPESINKIVFNTHNEPPGGFIQQRDIKLAMSFSASIWRPTRAIGRCAKHERSNFIINLSHGKGLFTQPE